MRSYFLFLLVLLMPANAQAAKKPSPEAEITKALDSWHEAAAKADEKAYFDGMSANMVFLGTDPLERWNKEEFRKYAHPHFAKGKGWEIRAMKRYITFSKDKLTAWFDEDALSTGLGPVRGSGVVVKEKGRWLVAQYNLSVPIYNERFDEVRKINVVKEKP